MQARISTWQLALISIGSMIGSGWLFSPFYGLQEAGGAVLLAWVLAALVSLVVSFSFARMCAAFPVVGGTYRLLGMTHPRSTANLFLIIGWLSYVVFLPLEAQSVVQYLGFWWPALVRHGAQGVELSWAGLALGVVMLLGITWFNSLHITRVARANSWVSVWKVVIPVGVVLIVLVGHGRWDTFVGQLGHGAAWNVEAALHAVIGTGLAFAFAGFQNGLILANQVRDPRRSLPFSLFLPLLFALALYMLLSISYMAAVPGSNEQLVSAAAPLLGLVSMLGLGVVMHVLLADAIVAPLGTGNVYAAVTARILYACGMELRPGSWVTRLNRHGSPVNALWLDAAVGLVFLLPFPTWKQLVSFLTSMVVFTYLTGPVSLLVLGRVGGPAGAALVSTPREALRARLAGMAGMLCCTCLVYWGGRINLGWLLLALLIALSLHGWSQGRARGVWHDLRENAYLIAFVAALLAVAWLRQAELLAFPWDNVLVALLGLAAGGAFVRASLDDAGIRRHVARIHGEQSSDAMQAGQVS